MAKIGTLEVTTLKIADNAVTQRVSSASSVAVPNAAGMPVEIYMRGTLTYEGGQSSSAANRTISIVRQRDSTVLYSETWSKTQAGFETRTLTVALVDLTATTSETYNITSSGTQQDGGSMGWSGSSMTAVYSHK